MAITLADFTKIWASTSPLTPYSFSESNYKQGWNFVGGTPPARQMWDSIQKQNDEKLKYIVDNFLPLDGGTMEGAISFDETGQIGYRATTHTEPANPCKQLIVSSTDIDHWGDEGGAKITLHTYDSTQTNTDEDGAFCMLATDGTNAKELKGKPNGDFTWAGHNVVTSNFDTFTVSKTSNMNTLSVGQAIRMGNLAIVSFDGQLTSTKSAWTDTDIMTLSVTTSGTTACIGLTNNGTSVLLQVASNKVTYRTLNHAVNDDTIRGVLVFPVSGF